jgi:ABC-type transport system involved in multi-copper enzyme maturation permease subunit
VALLGVMVLPSALVVGCAIGLAIVSVPSALSWSRYLGSAAGLASLLLAFLGLALLIGARVRRRGLAASRVAGLTVTLYLLDVFGERLAWLAWLRWTSPFRYFRSVPVALTGDWPVTHLLALVGVGLVAGALGFWRFGRGDSTG